MHLLRCVTIVLIFGSFAATPVSAQKKITVGGSILASDGAPPLKAHAHLTRLPWEHSEEHNYTIEAARDGKWITRVPPGLYRLRFTGVNHRMTEPVYVYIGHDADNTFTTRLGVNPYYEEHEIDTVFIVYKHLTSYGTRYDAMTPLGNGRYRGMLPCVSQETVCYHISGIMPQRNINGTQTLLYLYDGDGDYQSCVDCPENAGEMEIILDLALLPDHNKPEASQELVQGTPLQHSVAKGAAKLLDQIEFNKQMQQKHFDDYNALTDTIASGKDGKPWRQPRDGTSHAWTKWYVDMAGVHHYSDTTAEMELSKSVRAEYRSAFEAQRSAFEKALISGTAEDKLFAAAALAEAASKIELDSLQNTSGLLSRVFELIPPESPVWSLSQGYMLAAKLPDPARRAYLRGLIWRQRSSSARLGAYREYFSLLRRSGSEADSLKILTLLDSAMSVCSDGSCESESVIQAALGYKGMKAWRMKRLREGNEQAQRHYENLLPDELAGRSMPPFSLITLDSVRTMLSSEELRGTPYLLVIFKASMIGTSYGVEAALEASRVYKKQGLRSLLCYEIPDNPSIDRFTRHLEHPMYIMGEGLDALHTLNGQYANFADFRMLVDSDGIVRASNRRLSDDVLFYTLRDFFGEK
jgi:hypothetical protein